MVGQKEQTKLHCTLGITTLHLSCQAQHVDNEQLLFVCFMGGRVTLEGRTKKGHTKTVLELAYKMYKKDLTN